MATWCRKLALLLALAVMPLQGFAATLAVLICHGDQQLHAVHAQHGHDHDAEGAGHEHEHGPADGRDSGTAGGTLYHLCCNLAAAAPPFALLPAAAPDFPVRALVPDPLHDLFIPDRPQRPPLA